MSQPYGKWGSYDSNPDQSASKPAFFPVCHTAGKMDMGATATERKERSSELLGEVGQCLLEEGKG